MRLSYACLSLFTAAVLNCRTVQCQSGNDSSTQLLIAQFYQAVADNAFLYNGTEFTNADPAIKGDPYFLADALQKGKLVYNEVAYSDVPLLYDAWHDQLISQRYNNGVLMILISEKIKSFTIGNHQFTRLITNTGPNAALTTGFYELIYDGNSQVLAKHHKQIYESNSLEKSFVESLHFFIRKKDVYSLVKNRKDLLAVFRDKKDNVKKYIRQNKLNYKKEPARTLSAVAAFYDQLNQQHDRP